MSKYSFDEAKCTHEVYTKDDYIVLEGEYTFEQGSVSSSINIPLPEGVTYDNSIIISVMLKTPSMNIFETFKNNYPEAETSAFNRGLNISAALYGENGYNSDNTLYINIVNYEKNYNNPYKYKVVLLKYND